MKGKYSDLVTGLILGLTAGLFFPVGEYKTVLVIVTLMIVAIRLGVAK